MEAGNSLFEMFLTLISFDSAAAMATMAKKSLQPSPQEKAQSYLGLLFPTEQYRVYGYITNTNAKFVLVLHDQSTAKDPELKQARQLQLYFIIQILSIFKFFC